MIPEETIAEVKRRADLGVVIGRTVDLKKRGRNLIGLCPFHQEKTPSFNVRADEGFYKCFGCGAAGDVFTFLEQTSGQRFIDVLRGLASETGVELPEVRLSPEEEARREIRQRILRVLELTQIFFRQKLSDDDEGRAARAYLSDKRGIPDDVIDEFGIGFGGARDHGLVQFLTRHGVAPEVMREAGVVAEGRSGDYDFFRQRIIFPIRGRRGEVISFGGRAFGRVAEGKPKYINGPRTDVYDKSRELFGLFEGLRELKRGAPAILVEGYFDVVAMHRANQKSALAPCGTSLTDQHLDEIARQTDTLVICLDADDAGRKASEKAVLMALSRGLNVKLCELVEKDADAMLLKDGAEAVGIRVGAAKDAVDVLVERTLEKAVGRMGNRTAALEAALPYLAALPPKSLSTAAIVGRVAQVMGIDRDTLTDDLSRRGRDLLRQALGGSAKSDRGPSSSSSSSSSPREGSTATADASTSTKQPGTALAVQGSRAARVLVAPATVTWTVAEKSLVRALLCQPQLAPRCGVLVDVFKNTELKAFVHALSDALVRHHSEAARDVLRRVPVTPAVARIYADVFTRRGIDDPDQFLPEAQAARIIEDFVHTLERRPLEKRLGEIQRAIQSASDLGDIARVRHLIEAQRAVVNALFIPEGADAPAPTVVADAVPRVLKAATSVEPDGFVPDPMSGDDDGPDDTDDAGARVADADDGGDDADLDDDDFGW